MSRPNARRLLYLQYTNPAAWPPLEHSSRLLAREGWQILMLGIQTPGIEALQFPPHDRIVVRRFPACPTGWAYPMHYAGFGLWAAGWLIRWRPCWLYISDPSSCPLALWFSYLPRIRIIYHEHDTPSMAGPIAARRRTVRGILWARRQLAHRAALCILPNAQRVARFVETTGRRNPTLCVWNCPTLEEVATPRPALEGRRLRLLYHGSIVPPRLPPTVLEALAQLPETVTLRLIGYETIGHRGYLQSLQRQAQQLGLAGRVEFLGPLPRRAVLERSLTCDLGLALVPNDPAALDDQPMTGASNKAFDYLACGLALLVSDLPDWRALYVEPGYGRAVNPDDPRQIAEALRWCLEHPDEVQAMGERGRQRILEEWHYERQFAPVRAVLEAGR